MPTIDAYASASHYLDHMVPVWKALTKATRGTFYVAPDLQEYAAHKGVVNIGHAPVPPGDNVTLVSASGNLGHLVKRGRPNRAIMEHGCGLSYGGDLSWRGRQAAHSSSYAGGLGRDAGLFLHPGEYPAARDRAQYPKARVEVVGCPKLDTLPAREGDPHPTVAVSFHWDTSISPETRSAFIFYREHVKRLAAHGAKTGEFRVIGHAHPRAYERLAPWYKRQGIETVRSFEDVCRRADMYVVDNSSTLYEFASTGRQVVVMNAPFYRKEVHHGLRFWDAIPGPQVWEPYHLLDVIRYELEHPTLWTKRREEAVDQVYAFRSGAAKRAANALVRWAGTL
jgi:hypothetical protein